MASQEDRTREAMIEDLKISDKAEDVDLIISGVVCLPDADYDYELAETDGTWFSPLIPPSIPPC